MLNSFGRLAGLGDAAVLLLGMPHQGVLPRESFVTLATPILVVCGVVRREIVVVRERRLA
jgi:hypothetical protein